MNEKYLRTQLKQEWPEHIRGWEYMATITVTKSDTCAAGNHFTITVTGDAEHVIRYSKEEFLEPISDEEKAIFLRVLIKLAKKGRTAQQVMNALDAGHTVNI